MLRAQLTRELISLEQKNMGAASTVKHKLPSILEGGRHMWPLKGPFGLFPSRLGIGGTRVWHSVFLILNCFWNGSPRCCHKMFPVREASAASTTLRFKAASPVRHGVRHGARNLLDKRGALFPEGA